MAANKTETKQESAPVATDIGPEIVNKISAKTVCGTIQKPEKQTELFTVYGICNGYKTGTSTYGDWLAFTGSFEAIRSADKKVFTGGKVFLPGAVSDMLLSAMKVDKETGEIPEVQFALSVGVKPSDTPTGYEYTVAPIVKAGGADPLAQLRNAVADKLALPNLKAVS